MAHRATATAPNSRNYAEAPAEPITTPQVRLPFDDEECTQSVAKRAKKQPDERLRIPMRFEEAMKPIKKPAQKKPR